MTSITRWVVLWKLRIVFGVIPQLQRVIISALFLEQFCVPSSGNGRRDSLQVVGTPHLFAILISCWASSVCVLLLVSAACVELLSNISPQMSYWAYVGCVALR